MTERPNLRVLVFPADDVALRHEVDAAVHDLPADVSDSRQMAALEDRLRRWYRSIQVRARDSLGGYDDDPTRVWYVYRDGRIRARNDSLERLYVALANARDTCRTSASAIDAARSIARSAGRSGAGTRPPTSAQNPLDGDPAPSPAEATPASVG